MTAGSGWSRESVGESDGTALMCKMRCAALWGKIRLYLIVLIRRTRKLLRLFSAAAVARRGFTRVPSVTLRAPTPYRREARRTLIKVPTAEAYQGGEGRNIFIYFCFNGFCNQNFCHMWFQFQKRFCINKQTPAHAIEKRGESDEKRRYRKTVERM